MSSQAKLRYLQMSPNRVRALCNVIRGKGVQEAVDFLTHSSRRAARPLLKLVRSAISNADQKGGIDIDTLYIRRLECDEGPVAKRWLPRARGMASPILKRSSHITVELEQR